MLGWIAPALADRCFPSLDAGLVAQFALIHDMPEVYAETPPPSGSPMRDAAPKRYARPKPWSGWTGSSGSACRG